MKVPSVSKTRIWVLLATVVIAIAVHGAVLYYVSSHAMVSAAVASGLEILLVIKHVGILAPLAKLIRRSTEPTD